MRYLILFVDRHPSFRIPELKSLLHLFGCKKYSYEIDNNSPFLILNGEITNLV